MKRIFIITALFIFAISAKAEEVIITNSIFKAYLVERGFDLNGDNEISQTEADVIIELNLDGSWSTNISTIEGIEKLVNLEKVTGKYWDFKTVDLTNNTKLKHVSITSSTRSSTTGIESLNVSTCTDLEYLLIYAELTNLDLSNNTKLQKLNCDGNPIETLNITNSVNLHYLSCVNNNFSAFDISKNVNLDSLRCGTNDFSVTGFDISANTKLRYLNVGAANLYAINLSANTMLETIYCGHNKLSTINLTRLDKLQFLECGNNTIAELSFNPENSLMQTLWCNSNAMTSLNIDNCVNLTSLIASGNSLTDISLQNNVLLEALQIDSNPLGTIDLTKNLALKKLACYSNQLTALEVSKNTLLEIIHCYDNSLTELNIDTNAELWDLNFSDNNITTIDLSQNSKLEYLTAENTGLTALSIAYNFNIREITIGTNSFSSICIGAESNYVLEQIPVFRIAYPDYTFEECSTNSSIVYVNDASYVIGNKISVPVLVDNLLVDNNTISYQFKFLYNSEMLEFTGYTIENCITANGQLTTNEASVGVFNVSYMTTSAISGTGAIVNLEFNLLTSGTSELQIADFFFNATEVTNIVPANITATFKYGDVDLNGLVQAYDAALTLQYSVGMDPLPEIDTLPWAEWRKSLADVDGVAGISAFDATLILQYSVNLISDFPVESTTKSTKELSAFVDVTLEDNKIVFRSSGELLGFNLITENLGNLGEAQIIGSNLLSAVNITDNEYAIGVCAISSFPDGEIFVEIPYIVADSITLNLQLNNEKHTVTLNTATGISDINAQQIQIYPVPVTNMLTVRGIENITEISIFTITGEKILQQQSMENSINVSALVEGIYFIKIRNNKSEVISKRFMKQ